MKRSSRERERGAVLITVLLVMLALLGLGVMAMWMTSGNLQIGANTNLRNQALYVAEAGIEAVRNDLNGTAIRPMTTLLQGGKDTTNDNVPTGTGLDSAGLPNGVGAVYFLADNTVLSNVAFPPASFGRSSTTNSAQTMGNYTVWIRNDTAEIRQGTAGSGITTDTNNIVVVRSKGVAPDGRTQVTLEVTMGPGSTPGAPTGPTGTTASVLCNAGKNACDENSSVQNGIVVQ
jgi:Tfp pilus assembly protein PilX